MGWAILKLFEDAPIGIVMADPAGRIVGVNRAFAILLGCQAGDLVGTSLLEITDPADVELTRRRIDALQKGEPSTQFYLKHFRRKQGGTVLTQVYSVSPNIGLGEKVMLGLVCDLSEIEAAREHIQRLSDRLQLATGGQGVGVWDVDVRKDSVHLDDVCRRLYGLEDRNPEMQLDALFDALAPPDRAAMRDLMEKLLGDTGTARFETEFCITPLGAAPRWIHGSGVIERDSAGKAIRSVGLNRDITSQHAMQEKVTLQAAAMDAASNLIFITTTDGKIVWVNQAFTQASGYSEAEVIGRNPRFLKSGQQSPDWYRDLWNTVSGGKVWRGRMINRRKNGELFDSDQTITPIPGRTGSPAYFVSVSDDISEQVRSDKMINTLARFDSTTGLPNRGYFRSHLTAALESRTTASPACAVIVVDLDHFQRVNDTLGHATADQVLAEVAQRLRTIFGSSSFPSRCGGDEFAILTGELSGAEAATEIAERIQAAIREPYTLAGHVCHVGTSMGIVMIAKGKAEASPEEILRQADLALHSAKAGGRDRAHFFDPRLDAAASRRFTIEHELRQAIEAGELNLVYQPQFRIPDGALCGIEALLRWKHRDLGLIPPGEFVALAEKCGFSESLDTWVMREACRQAGAWKRDSDFKARVAINVSADLIGSTHLVDLVMGELEHNSLDPSSIEIEVTEGVMLFRTEVVTSNLAELGRRGVALAIDDFGTGYSSLCSLRDFPVSRLKIDASFVRGIGRPTKDEQIIRAIIGLGKSLDLDVISEGVETTEQLDFLRRAGCAEVQGYLYARPMPPQELLDFLAARREGERELDAESMR